MPESMLLASVARSPDPQSVPSNHGSGLPDCSGEEHAMASNPSEFFKTKAEQLQEGGGSLDGINAIYQFNLSGDDGGSWVIDLASDAKGVREGEEDTAQCVISMTAPDFMSMIQGSLNPQMAFMTGKLRVKGDMGLALKLQSILG